MTQITIDSSIANRLQELTDVVQVCDPSGKVLGRFLPLTEMSDWEPVSADVSEEELDRRELSNEWHSS